MKVIGSSEVVKILICPRARAIARALFVKTSRRAETTFPQSSNFTHEGAMV